MLVEFSKNIARFRGHNIMFPLLFVLLLTSSAHAEPLSYLGIRYTPQPLRFQASGPALPFDKTENHDDFGMYIRKQPAWRRDRDGDEPSALECKHQAPSDPEHPHTYCTTYIARAPL